MLFVNRPFLVKRYFDGILFSWSFAYSFLLARFAFRSSTGPIEPSTDLLFKRREIKTHNTVYVYSMYKKTALDLDPVETVVLRGDCQSTGPIL